MALKMTKEVKTFAEREFDKKVNEAREKFEAPFRAQEKETYSKVAERMAKINQEFAKLRAEYPDYFIEVSRCYDSSNTKKEFSVSVRSREMPKFQSPDKVRFMAELSTGETLDDITTMLEKYFS